MNNLRVTIDKEAVEKRLKNMSSQAPKVIARALNDTAKDARRRLADKARDTYTVKIGGFTNHVRFTQRASAGLLDAILGVDGRSLTLNRYSTRQKGAYAQVLKDGGFKELRSQNSGALAFKGSGGSVSGLITQRKTRDRYPLRVLHGPSVPQMVGSEKRVYGIVKPDIQKVLDKNISKEIERVLR